MRQICIINKIYIFENIEFSSIQAGGFQAETYCLVKCNKVPKSRRSSWIVGDQFDAGVTEETNRREKKLKYRVNKN